MTKSHRKAPLFGIPEHPAGVLLTHSLNLDDRIKHNLAELTHHKSGVTNRILTHHKHHAR
jgi:hypothetical protein